MMQYRNEQLRISEMKMVRPRGVDMMDEWCERMRWDEMGFHLSDCNSTQLQLTVNPSASFPPCLAFSL